MFHVLSLLPLSEICWRTLLPKIVLLFHIVTNFPGIDKEQDMQYKYKIHEIEPFFSEDFNFMFIELFSQMH